MADVWYIGDAQVREWNGFRWSIWNGWSIPESAFTAGQLDELDADPGFLLGQTGPRVNPPWSPDSTVGRESVYLQQMKAIYDEVPSRLSKAALDGTYAPALVAPRTSGVKAVGQGELMVNVKDYGAVGDGSANDSAAIAAALEALAAIIGADNAAGVLFFPPGAYRDYNLHTIESTRRIHLRGSGMDTTSLIRPSGSTPGDWWTFNARHSGISDMTLSGGRYQGVTGDNIVLNGAYSYASRVWCQKAGGNGITIGKGGTAIAHRLNEVQVRENAGRGIETVAGSGCTDGMWSDVEVGMSGQYGVMFGTGSQNVSNLHVWQSGLESATENDGIYAPAGSNEMINAQSEKNLGRGFRIESRGNTIRGRAWGNCQGAMVMNNAAYNDVDIASYRNCIANTAGVGSDSFAQCLMGGTSIRNRIRMMVWDTTDPMDPGNYVTPPTYPYPGRDGGMFTHTRALVSTSANCDHNTFEFHAPRDVSRVSSGTAPYTTLGVNDFYSPACNWGSNVPVPVQSVASGTVRIPPQSDTIVVSVSQEITNVVGGRSGRIARIIWTNASPQPIRDNGTTLNLNGDFTPTQNDTMTLVSDGTNWYELSRSAN